MQSKDCLMKLIQLCKKEKQKDGKIQRFWF